MLGVVHMVLLLIAHLLVTARLLHIGRLSDDKLAHFVDEKALSAREKA